jgi:hypothetical protein
MNEIKEMEHAHSHRYLLNNYQAVNYYEIVRIS